MAGCPDSGAAGTNKRLLDRLYQEVATTDAETDKLNDNIKAVNNIAKQKEDQQKAFMKDANNTPKEKRRSEAPARIGPEGDEITLL